MDMLSPQDLEFVIEYRLLPETRVTAQALIPNGQDEHQKNFDHPPNWLFHIQWATTCVHMSSAIHGAGHEYGKYFIPLIILVADNLRN
jgi:hypothetical protein